MCSELKVRGLEGVGGHGRLSTCTDQYIGTLTGFWNMETPKGYKHLLTEVMNSWAGVAETRVGTERQVQWFVRLKILGTIGKSFQRKDSGPTQSFDVLPAALRMPHSFTLTWTSGFHQHEESTLICLKTGSWKGEQVPRGSWQTVLAGCQLQKQLGVLLLLAATVAPRWGLEACALFLNSESRVVGGIGYQRGKSGSHWKLWCHSQICYCSQLGSPFDSWGWKPNPFWNQKKRKTSAEFQEMPSWWNLGNGKCA